MTGIMAVGAEMEWKTIFVAVVSFLVTAIVAVRGKGFLKIIPFLIGIITGYIAAICVGIVDFKPIAEAAFFSMPQFIIPFINYTPSFSAILTTARAKGSLAETLQYSFYEVKYWICSTIESLGQLVTGHVGINDMSGPVGIVKTIGDTYTEAKSSGAFMVFLNMLNICILLSANLGIMNLLPIPALDGGRLVFLLVEAVRGKRMDPNKEGAVNLVFLMLLMALMVVIMFNDIRKIVM